MQCIVHHHRHIRICIVVLVDLQFCKTWCSKPLLLLQAIIFCPQTARAITIFANADDREKWDFGGQRKVSIHRVWKLPKMSHFTDFTAFRVIRNCNCNFGLFLKKKFFPHKDCLAYFSNTVDYRFNARAIRKLSSEL